MDGDLIFPKLWELTEGICGKITALELSYKGTFFLKAKLMAYKIVYKAFQELRFNNLESVIPN